MFGESQASSTLNLRLRGVGRSFPSLVDHQNHLEAFFFFFNSLFILVWLYWVLVETGGMELPDQRWNPGPPHWEHGGLTTGPPGKSRTWELWYFALGDSFPPAPSPDLQNQNLLVDWSVSFSVSPGATPWLSPSSLCEFGQISHAPMCVPRAAAAPQVACGGQRRCL